MGIQGLLPALKSVAERRSVAEYCGRSVAVDVSCWLHKGSYRCAREMCLGEPTSKYVDYCLDYVRLLQGHGVRPVLVLDGRPLPAKRGENASRAQSREAALDRALRHLAEGNASSAAEAFQRAVVIRPVHNKVLLEAVKAHGGVDFVVAPYEADAQLAFLALSGRVHAVISEDSDLLAYGCPRVLYKMGKDGFGEEICLERLPLCKPLSLVGFSQQMLLEMCVLSGCDFLPNLKGIGPKKAHALMKRFRHFVRAVKHLRYNGTHVPRSYEDDFHCALLVFKHQRVWDSEAGELRHLEPIPEGGLAISLERSADSAAVAKVPADSVELDFLGAHIDGEVARGIAVGDVNPHTLEPYPAVEEMLAGGRLEAPQTAAARTQAQTSQAAGAKRKQAGEGPLGKFFQRPGLSNAAAAAAGPAPAAGTAPAAGPAPAAAPAPEALPFWRRRVTKGLKPAGVGKTHKVPELPMGIEHLRAPPQIGAKAQLGSKRPARPPAEKAKRSKFFTKEDSPQLPSGSQNTLDLDLEDAGFEVQVSQVSPPPADAGLGTDLKAASQSCQEEGRRAFEKIKAQAAFSRFACEPRVAPPSVPLALTLVDNGCRKPFNPHKARNKEKQPRKPGAGNVFDGFGCGAKN